MIYNGFDAISFLRVMEVLCLIKSYVSFLLFDLIFDGLKIVYVFIYLILLLLSEFVLFTWKSTSAYNVNRLKVLLNRDYNLIVSKLCHLWIADLIVTRLVARDEKATTEKLRE